MSQLNMHINIAFERDLKRFMAMRHIKTKSEAVRIAIKESLEHSLLKEKQTNFFEWIDIGNREPVNNKPRFPSDSDLWK